MTDLAKLAEAMLAVTEVGAAVLEACDGYRAQCTEHGYSSGVVDSMVADFHRALIQMTLGQIGQRAAAG